MQETIVTSILLYIENLAKFRYLRMILRDRKCIHEEIKNISHLWITWYLSAQNVLSPLVIYKYVAIKTYRNIILPVTFYGCEAWSLTISKLID
jgi:hypothetical protein